MSKRFNELFLFDIYIAILKIEKHSNRFKSGEELKHSYENWDLIIRQFEIIGEATNNLIKSNFFNKDKRDIVDVRNILIHEYFGIDAVEIWEIIKKYLPSLKQEICLYINNINHEEKQTIIKNFLIEFGHIDYISDSLKNL